MLKYSRQREEVFQAVLSNRIHPTANDVYDIVKRSDSGVSLATVYRNLNMLADMGLLLKIEIPNASDRFDGTTYSHYHLVCDECGSVIDVEYDLSDLPDKVEQQTGARVSKYSLVISGICKDCENKKEIVR